MGSKIVRAADEHLGQCVKILADSDLGRIYFGSGQNIENTLAVGIATEEVYVAISDGGECMGFIWFAYRASFHSFPYLHIIAVDEKLRGRGLGRELMEFFESLIFPQFAKAFLVVADFNPRAKKLYESLGYVEVGAIPGLYKNGITEYLMMKLRPDTQQPE